MKTLKLLSVFVIALALFSFVGVKAAKAMTTAPVVQVGVVEGLVYGQNNAAVPGASVSVLCNGHTLPATSDPSGFYFVQYGNGLCVAGQGVTVTATKGALTGTKNGTMQADGATLILKLDVAVVNVPMVPEFGLITGAVAFLSSGGVFLALKKKRA
jgi:hypothetical protein